jgi:hypothetical protein
MVNPEIEFFRGFELSRTKIQRFKLNKLKRSLDQYKSELKTDSFLVQIVVFGADMNIVDYFGLDY